MQTSIRNLDFIRQIPGFGQKLFEALSDVQQNHSNLVQQTNGNSTGHPVPPPRIDAFRVTGYNGHFNMAITDNSPVFRGIQYHVEHADNPQFNGAHVIDLGNSRNHTVFMGDTGRYWRAYSSYPTSGPSAPVHHGGDLMPTVVYGGGFVGAPDFLSSQSSGTGQPGQTGQGPGVAPYRAVNGAPAKR